MPFRARIAAWEDTLASAPLLLRPACKVAHRSVDDQVTSSSSRPPRKAVSVIDKDTIDLARQYVRPLVMNLADDFFPGGCVYTGSGAQEESLFRRTNLFRSLLQSFYPIKADEAVYSPGVAVFKESEANGFARIEPPFELDFVSCPGIRHPQLTEEGALTEADRRKLTKKIELVLDVAVSNGHDTIVMGALGCGAWLNPPAEVAAIIKDVLDKSPYEFEIAFGIKRGTQVGYTTRLPDSRPDNFAAFASVFASNK